MDLSGTTVIKRPLGEVYAYVMDLANDGTWRTGVDTSGMRGGGAIETGATGFTRAGKAVVEWRILSHVEHERVDWELLGDGPFQGTGGYRFEAVEGGTRFTLVAEIEPGGVYKLFGPLFYRMGRRRNQADVEKLRDLLEVEPPATGAP